MCIKRYLSMQAAGYGEEKPRQLLTMFHSTETVADLYGQMERGENPFTPFVLHCDGEHCEGCHAFGCCGQKHTMALVSLIREKAKELDFDAFAAGLTPYVRKT